MLLPSTVPAKKAYAKGKDVIDEKLEWKDFELSFNAKESYHTLELAKRSASLLWNDLIQGLLNAGSRMVRNYSKK